MWGQAAGPLSAGAGSSRRARVDGLGVSCAWGCPAWVWGKLWPCGQEGDRRPDTAEQPSLHRVCTMSAHLRPHLGVCLWLWLGVTVGRGQGQGKDLG